MITPWRQALADDIVRRIFDRIEKDRGIHKDSLVEEALTALTMADAMPKLGSGFYAEPINDPAQVHPNDLVPMWHVDPMFVTEDQMEHLKRIAPDQVAAGHYAVNGPIPMTAEDCLKSAARVEQANEIQAFVDLVGAKLSGSPEFQKLIEDLHLYGNAFYTTAKQRPGTKFVAGFGPDMPVTFGQSPATEPLENARKIREQIVDTFEKLPPTPKPVSVPPSGRQGWTLIGYVSTLDHLGQGKVEPGAYYLSSEPEIPGAKEGEQHGAYVEVDDQGHMWRVTSRLTKGTICVFRERGPVLAMNYGGEDIPILVSWSGKHDGSMLGKLNDEDKDMIARFRAEMDEAWKRHNLKARDYIAPPLFTKGDIFPFMPEE